MGGAPNWFLSHLWVPLCKQESLPGAPGKVTPSVGSIGLLLPGRDSSPDKLGLPSPRDKEVKRHHLQIPDEPLERLQGIQAGKSDTKAFWEAMFIYIPAA
jgi:hypothetical protein